MLSSTTITFERSLHVFPSSEAYVPPPLRGPAPWACTSPLVFLHQRRRSPALSRPVPSHPAQLSAAAPPADLSAGSPGPVGSLQTHYKPRSSSSLALALRHSSSRPARPHEGGKASWRRHTGLALGKGRAVAQGIELGSRESLWERGRLKACRHVGYRARHAGLARRAPPRRASS